MKNKSWEDLLNIIKESVEREKKSISKLKSLCQESGMKDGAIERFLEFEKVKNCPYCETFNLYEGSYNSKRDWSMYECGSCEKSWYVDWQKEGEKFKLDR